MIKHVYSLILLLSILNLSAYAQDEDENAQHWNGEWVADGTLFKIGVSVENNVMTVRQIESLGFVWSGQEGKVNGNTVQVEIAYGGVTGVIQAELIDPTTAIVFAASCTPDFMVVCALARDRQVIFRKVGEPGD